MVNLRAWIRSGTVLVAGAAVACDAGCAKPEEARAPDAVARVARLQRANGLLQRQVDLAAGKDFYLVLEPGASNLTLMLNGAELQRYPVVGLQVGEPRVSWIARRDRRAWRDTIWSKGELDPPRQLDRFVVQAPPPAEGGAEPEPPPVPPTPEEMYPVPRRYHVRFDEGWSIEVRPLDADPQAGRAARLAASASAKAHDVFAAAFWRKSDAVRLRLALAPKDAASLYRSLPPAVRLLILPKGGPAPARTPARPSQAPAAKPAGGAGPR
jgi:hypothetical protein